MPLILFTWVVVVGLSGCSKGVDAKLHPLPKDGVILAFGDSITYGTGAEDGEDYPARLQELTGLRVIRSGVPGETTAEGLARMASVLDQADPDLVIICEGGNDILHGIAEAEIAANLEAMIRTVRERGIDVVLIAVPHFSFGLKDLPLYEEIGKRLKLPVLKGVLARILSRPSLKSDMIHPNAEGYRVLAEEVARLLRERGALPAR